MTRLALVSEEVLVGLLRTQADADDNNYRIEWGQAITEVVTYYEPVVITSPKLPPIETREDDDG